MIKLLFGILISFFGVQLAAQSTISLGVDLLSKSISSEYEISKSMSLRFDLGFILSDNSSLRLNPQLHFQKDNNSYELEDVGMIMPYHGPSFVFILNSSDNVYATEFRWGFELELYKFPIELYVDAGPSFQFNNNYNSFTLTSSFGVRYKF